VLNRRFCSATTFYFRELWCHHCDNYSELIWKTLLSIHCCFGNYIFLLFNYVFRHPFQVIVVMAAFFVACSDFTCEEWHVLLLTDLVPKTWLDVARNWDSWQRDPNGEEKSHPACQSRHFWIVVIFVSLHGTLPSSVCWHSQYTAIRILNRRRGISSTRGSSLRYVMKNIIWFFHVMTLIFSDSLMSGRLYLGYSIPLPAPSS